MKKTEDQGERPSSSATTWAAMTHLSSFGGWVLPWLGQVVFPLIVWGLGRKRDPFVDDQGLEASNFGVTMAIVDAGSWIFFFATLGRSMNVYAVILLVLAVAFQSLFVIIAAIMAKGGKRYRYPICLRLL
ncbi:MAG: DUF4870 domain-containing protein [Deltaproteobacteria bacterium]|nr:DUF4870 domain-containing protein [Deltaproteobacteria bacterium]